MFNWLVVSNIIFIFHFIYIYMGCHPNPIDELHDFFQDGETAPPTRNNGCSLIIKHALPEHHPAHCSSGVSQRPKSTKSPWLGQGSALEGPWLCDDVNTPKKQQPILGMVEMHRNANHVLMKVLYFHCLVSFVVRFSFAAAGWFIKNPSLFVPAKESITDDIEFKGIQYPVTCTCWIMLICWWWRYPEKKTKCFSYGIWQIIWTLEDELTITQPGVKL